MPTPPLFLQRSIDYIWIYTVYPCILIGGFNPPEKYESDWIIISTGENLKFHGSKPPTRYILTIINRD